MGVSDYRSVAALPAHHARRAHRVRHRRHAAQPRAPHRPAVRLRRAGPPGGGARPASDVPDVRRRADRRRDGAVRSTSRARTCPSSARSKPARCTTAWGTPGTASAPPTWVAASWRRGRSAATTMCSTCRSSTPARCGSRPSPSAPRERCIANHAIRRKDESEDRGEEPNPVVDFVAKLPGAWATTWVPDRVALAAGPVGDRRARPRSAHRSASTPPTVHDTRRRPPRRPSNAPRAPARRTAAIAPRCGALRPRGRPR